MDEVSVDDKLASAVIPMDVEDRIPRLFRFRKVGSYGTWLQLMCCAGLVVRPYISEYPEVRDG